MGINTIAEMANTERKAATYEVIVPAPEACDHQTDELDTAGYGLAPNDPVNDGNASKSPLSHGYRTARCSESSCDAGARPASSAEDGSQKPPCDPSLTQSIGWGRSTLQHPPRRRLSSNGLIAIQLPKCRQTFSNPIK